MLTSTLGAFLPAWGYHLNSNFITVGNYFLALNAGLLVAIRGSAALLPRMGIGRLMVSGSTLASAAFGLLALEVNPLALSRGFGLFLLGFSAGLLHIALSHAISPLFNHDRAATATLAGTLYGLGCFLTAILAAGTYYVYSVTWILVLFAAIPALFAVVLARGHFPREVTLPQGPLRQVLDDFKNPGAILFALILFFQFGNEWSIAGWLPLFLIRRLGISPEASVFMLAFYWGSLLVGRVAAKAMLKSVPHGRLLMGSIVLALLGCVILTNTTDAFSANTGILFIGCGFASIYPLVVEKMGHRFTYYHPGLYNGIFSFAVTGGLLAPALLGYLAQSWGVGVILVIPMLGTFMVFLLVLLIMLEAKLSGEKAAREAKA